MDYYIDEYGFKVINLEKKLKRPIQWGAKDACPHDELDHGVCYECGKDLSEWLLMKAYDNYKDWD